MNQIKTILIDIREEFELLETMIISKDKSLLVMNVPSRAIFANKQWINNISNLHKIYLVCRSGNRTSKIKEKYFPNNKNVKSVIEGIKNIENNSLFKIKLLKGKGGIGIQQYIQLAFVCMLSLLLVLLYYGIDKKYIILLIMAFILFIVYQVYSKGCLISSLVPLPEF